MTTVKRIIYVVDDDPAVRRSLERLLDSADFHTVSLASPKAFLDTVASSPEACCALVDLRLPEMSGIKVVEQLRAMELKLPVIVMTGHGDVQSAVRAIKAGAADFIEKPYTDETLMTAIESALAAGPQGSRAAEIAEAVTLMEALSPRERQVLDALVSGHANKAIAFQLGISVRTVEVHRARMMDRLGVRQLGEAVRFAVLAAVGRGG